VTRKRGEAAVGLLFVLIGVSFFCQNCAPIRIVHQSFPPIGQTISLSSALNNKPVKADHEYQNVMIYLVSGGRTIGYDENAVIQMFEREGDSAPIYEFSMADLKHSYQKTGCSRDLSAHLENAFEGEALFCGNQLDLSKAKLFIYKRSNGREKSATSYVVEFVKPDQDLLAVGIAFR
jgi:hypothetical protein